MPQLYVLNKSKLQLNTSHSSTHKKQKRTQPTSREEEEQLNSPPQALISFKT